MTSNKVILFVLIICITLSCKSNNNDDFSYPKVIDSLQLREQYDDAKWRMYCMYSDKYCDFVTTYRNEPLEELDSITFGTMKLKLDTVRFKNVSMLSSDMHKWRDYESVQIIMSFSYDSLRCYYYTNQKGSHYIINPHFEVASGIAYELGKDTPLYFIFSSSNTYYNSWDSLNRDTKPLQPSVIKYIRENKDKINPWFREEAEKRGVFNDSLK